MSLNQWHQRYQQQARWTANIREYLFSQANVQPDGRVLEVGSGTGAVLNALANEQTLKLFGVDINRSSLKYASALNPAFKLVQADGNLLPYSNNEFQITCCHYLLLWVMDPQRILQEMQRVTQPGGWVIALAEPDHQSRLDYPPPLEQLGELQTRALTEQGADTALGRRLRALFEEAAFSEMEAGILGAQWTTGLSKPEESEWMMLRSDLGDQLSDDQLAKYLRIDQESYQRGSRVLFIPTFYAIGQVP